MKSKLLLITALLASAVAPTFGQAANPMATPNATETFALVLDGTNNTLPLKWDVYLPSSQGQHPAVLVIFGGRFLGGSRADVASVASDLAVAGFVALAIDVRTDKVPNSISQQYPVYAPPAVPNQPGDVKLAVTAARTGLIPTGTSIIQPYITQKVGAVGGSSGASLALWCAATGSLSSDKLDAAVLFSAATEFDDQDSLMYCGLIPPCSYGMHGPTFRQDVFRYCHQILDPSNQYCGDPLPTPFPQTQLQGGSPIYQIQANVSPLFWISDPGDPMPPNQFSDLTAKIQSFNLQPPIYQPVTAPTQCKHSFDMWTIEQMDVVNWLHARLGP